MAALLEEDKNEDGRALVQEQCPACNHNEAKYSTLQVFFSTQPSALAQFPSILTCCGEVSSHASARC